MLKNSRVPTEKYSASRLAVYFISMFDGLSFDVRARNRTFRRRTARIHATVIAPKNNPMYGAHADKVPRKRMRNC